MQIALPVKDIESLANQQDPNYGDLNLIDLAKTSKRSEDACTAIAVLGAVVLCVCSFSTILPTKRLLTCSNSVLALANIMSLIAYIVREEEARRTKEGASPQTPGDPESSLSPEQVSQKMPTIFTTVEENK